MPARFVSVKVWVVAAVLPLHVQVSGRVYLLIITFCAPGMFGHVTVAWFPLICHSQEVGATTGFGAGVWFIGGVHWVWSDLLLFGFTAAM